MKQSGILLHLSSLATDYGIGDLGTAAYRFCDYLKENSHSFWQILPLNHCGYGNSPYNPISAFAYNKFLISPDMLAEKSYLSRAELQAAKLPHTSSVDYEAVYRIKGQLLDLAAERMLKDIDVEEYIRENAWHLKPYLAFTMLSQKMHSSEWYLWPHEIRHYSDKLYDELYQENKLEMRKTAVLQKVFEEQFTRLKAYMTESGVSLIGDLPLYL
ncbi:MAG: 4-alpha-glucanotransferase, partial [Candidatus Cloacimonetes bacterium]|nr:4-alpha-glucanotransferase [Candidatus Cloacimonadota bacterium]